MRSRRGQFALKPFLAGTLAVVVATVAVLGTRNVQAGVSVVAHEVGRHLQGDAVTARGSRSAIEVEADESSRFALGGLRASLADAQAAVQALADNGPSAIRLGKQALSTAMVACPWWWWWLYWWGW